MPRPVALPWPGHRGRPHPAATDGAGATPDPLALATLHHNQAVVLTDLERDAEAIGHLEQTLALRQAAGLEGMQLSPTLTQLGGALLRLGRVEGARDALERAMALEPDEDGPSRRARRRCYLAGSLAEVDRPRAQRLLVDALRELEAEPNDDVGLAAECRALAPKLRGAGR